VEMSGEERWAWAIPSAFAPVSKSPSHDDAQRRRRPQAERGACASRLWRARCTDDPLGAFHTTTLHFTQDSGRAAAQVGAPCTTRQRGGDSLTQVGVVVAVVVVVVSGDAPMMKRQVRCAKWRRIPARLSRLLDVSPPRTVTEARACGT